MRRLYESWNRREGSPYLVALACLFGILSPIATGLMPSHEVACFAMGRNLAPVDNAQRPCVAPMQGGGGTLPDCGTPCTPQYPIWSDLSKFSL